MEFQTRDCDGALRFFTTIKEAFQYATSNESVWKVSFTLPTGERVRFIKQEPYGGWIYEPIEITGITD